MRSPMSWKPRQGRPCQADLLLIRLEMEYLDVSNSGSSSSESEEEYRKKVRKCAVLVVASATRGSATTSLAIRGGSVPGRPKCRDNGIEEGAEQIDRFYFNRTSLLSAPIFEADFERRFRMPRSVYELLREGLVETDRYFTQRRDAVGKLGASTDQKMVCALRQLAYGVPADAVCEYVRLSESTASESLHRVCAGIRKRFEGEWLRRPNAEEISIIERHYATLGFPGCIGCVDVASWNWDNCPVGWQGQYSGKDKKPCNRLEVVCDDFLRIWHCNFGAPGARNDINIYNQSLFFNDIRSGKWPSVEPSIKIGDFDLTWYYLLADGIYPRVKHLITSMKATTAREKLFANQQESVRKSVERVFGVMFQRFNIIYQPSRLFDKGSMEDVMYACCIIHNMVVESRKESYTGTRHARLINLQACLGSSATLITEPEDLREASLFWASRLDEEESPRIQKELKNALASYMWAQKGSCTELNDVEQ
jgi:Plant transposon protein